MKYLFYFLAVIPFVYELEGLISPKSALEEILSYNAMAKKKKEKHSLKHRSMTLWVLFYLLWLFVGLFTFQWWAFLLLLCMGLVPKKTTWYVCIDSALSIVIILFILLNAAHFKITFPF